MNSFLEGFRDSLKIGLTVFAIAGIILVCSTGAGFLVGPKMITDVMDVIWGDGPVHRS